ncbi:polyphosphate kinase 2 family protein [Caldimonas mangrovi]|uniref:hypothetical protein n=1 Tax=Caldimonas mangrovi TaxID=2944811 RepID=UPI00387E4259
MRLDELQDLLYADDHYKLLVVLQGMDTCGKDGTIRDVFGRMSPQGVHSVAVKSPSAEELAHDFLWRVPAKVPRTGELVVFNRSHYEDVLVPEVRGLIPAKQVQQRCRHINEFERLLTDTGTVIVKCFLHISKREQLERLQARLDTEARKHWDDDQRAYEDAIGATGTPWAPWTVVPAAPGLKGLVLDGGLVVNGACPAARSRDSRIGFEAVPQVAAAAMAAGRRPLVNRSLEARRRKSAAARHHHEREVIVVAAGVALCHSVSPFVSGSRSRARALQPSRGPHTAPAPMRCKRYTGAPSVLCKHCAAR